MVLGLTFLFAAILWALPLAGIPILLHLLFERKSPTVMFSTLRFIQAALKQTAARRKIQKWLLLACRILLLGLLIWAVSQPVKQLAWGFLSAKPNTLAAIVVDASPSMLLKQSEIPILARENEIVRSLLSGPLKDAEVALFLPGSDEPQIRKASELLEQWTDISVKAAAEPVARTAERAGAFLDRQQAGSKWLVVLSDLQKREFPVPMPPVKDARSILFDLRPDKFASTGITQIKTIPQTPVVGLGVQAEVELFGQAGAAAFVDLALRKPDGTTLWSRGNFPVNFENTGLTKIRIPLDQSLGGDKWMVLSAKLNRTDDLPFDDSLDHVLRLADRKTVFYVENPSLPTANRLIQFCLRPFSDPSIPWALDLKTGKNWEGNPDAVVMAISEWPGAEQLQRMRDYARQGGTLVILTLPGLEETYGALSEERKEMLGELMPSTPIAEANAGAGMFRATVMKAEDPILEEIADPSARLDQLVIRRHVPLQKSRDATKAPLVGLVGETATPGGLFYRVKTGEGLVYWLTTLPDGLDVSPPTHAMFPILLVKSCLGATENETEANVLAGVRAALGKSDFTGEGELEISSPEGSKYRVSRNEQGVYEYETTEPGLYVWKTPGDEKTIALTRAGYSAGESELVYCAQAEVMTGEGVVARSFDDLLMKAKKLDEPEPRWTIPIVMAMGLLCLEALIAAWNARG